MQNQNIKNELFNVIETQINTNDPEITAKTLQRLLNAGIKRDTAISRIAAELVIHMHEIMKNNTKFNLAKYTDQLNAIKP